MSDSAWSPLVKKILNFFFGKMPKKNINFFAQGDPLMTKMTFFFGAILVEIKKNPNAFSNQLIPGRSIFSSWRLKLQGLRVRNPKAQSAFFIYKKTQRSQRSFGSVFSWNCYLRSCCNLSGYPQMQSVHWCCYYMLTLLV